MISICFIEQKNIRPKAFLFIKYTGTHRMV